GRVSRAASPHLAAIVPQMLDTAVAAGYIVVYQDVRGQHGSEGDYVLTRPLKGPWNPPDPLPWRAGALCRGHDLAAPCLSCPKSRPCGGACCRPWRAMW
ncbi:MAG: CocE/NonD family hydrolase, partial [Caulobacteraceae bacterium]